MKEKIETRTKKEIDLDEFKNKPFVTISGRMTINELNKQLGLPKGVMQYARIEARTGSINPVTIIVERFVEGLLIYNDDLIVKGVKESMMKQLETNGVEVQYVHKPDYNPEKMPKATQKEYNDWAKKQRKELHAE